MPLPAGFPQAPRAPDASVPMTDPAWTLYFAKLNAFLAQLRAHVNTL